MGSPASAYCNWPPAGPEQHLIDPELTLPKIRFLVANSKGFNSGRLTIFSLGAILLRYFPILVFCKQTSFSGSIEYHVLLRG
jgi:hypothetical protein